MYKKASVFLLLLLSWTGFGADISAFTQGMDKQTGFYTFYYDQANGKVFLQIDGFEQPFLFQSSLPAGVGSNDLGLDRGQLGETRLVQFEHFGKKILLKQLNVNYRANAANVAEQQSVAEAFATSVLAGFEVVAEDNKGRRVLIDYTPYLLSDVHGIGNHLSASKQGNYGVDGNRSAVYPKRTKAFVDNTEFEAVITFAGSEPGEFVKQVVPDPNSITVRLHHSLVRLPDNQYQPRAYDPYSGYWSVEYSDYSTAIDQPMVQRLIPRHRLAKKDKSAKLSAPVAPIIYYLDPGVPEPVRSALLDGASWWNQAFEAIGYQDAFQVKMLPAGVDPMDIHYNVIQWVHRATRGWSYGSSVIDPRTGEIIKGHVTLGSLRVRQDLLIAQGLTGAFDGDEAKLVAAKAMALDRIRQLAAHEVGHTLGLAHNFAASVNGRASVMDYPHPLASLNDQGDVVLTDAYDKGIGVWDKYVIAYGYGDFAGDESQGLAQLVQQTKDQGLLYISDPDARVPGAAHPQGHLWDNGQDSVVELQRMMAVRAKALAKFGLTNLAKGQSLSQLEERLVPIYLYHRYQLEAVVKLLGGLDYQYESKTDRPAIGASMVSRSQQQAALQSILDTLSPAFLTLQPALLQLLLPKAYGESRNRESFVGRTGVTFDPVSMAEASAHHGLGLLLQPERLNRMQLQAVQVEGGLTVGQLVEQLLTQTLKADPYGGLAGQIQQRVGHLTLGLLVGAMQAETVTPEVKAEINAQLLELQQHVDKIAAKKRHPQMAFYRWLGQQLQSFNQSGIWPAGMKPIAVPPGSPI